MTDESEHEETNKEEAPTEKKPSTKWMTTPWDVIIVILLVFIGFSLVFSTMARIKLRTDLDWHTQLESHSDIIGHIESMEERLHAIDGKDAVEWTEDKDLAHEPDNP